MKICIVQNEGVKDSFILKGTQHIIQYFEKDAPKKFGVPKINIEIDYIKTNFPIGIAYSHQSVENKGVWRTSNTRMPLMDEIKGGQYDIVIFTYSENSISKTVLDIIDKANGYLAGAHFGNQLWIGTALIEIPDTYTSPYVFSHEIMHAIVDIMSRKLGVTIIDEMDKTWIESKKEYETYYKNNNPTHKSGNYSKTWNNLKPYLPFKGMIEDDVKNPPEQDIELDEVHYVQLRKDGSLVRWQFEGKMTGNMYIPKYFKPYELFPAKVIADLGDRVWQLMDSRLLMILDYIREHVGKPIIVNGNKYQYRGFDDGNYRKGYSQHKFGRAVDFDIQGLTAEEGRQFIINLDLPFDGIWLEKDVNWIHLDIRASDKVGVYLFKA